MPDNTFKILLADDNEANQLLFSKMLIMAGHDVMIVTNGQEALNELKNNTYDLCLFDMQMPVMTGAAAIKKYKDENPETNLPFIMLTADTSKEALDECKEAGVEIYLNKPVRFDDLKNAVENACLSNISSPTS